MPGPRHRNLLRSRRRVEDEGEEEDSGIAADAGDSQSEASVPTDHEHEGEADDSDISELNEPVTEAGKAPLIVNGSGNGQESKPASKPESGPSGEKDSTAFTMPRDTKAMTNGLEITEPNGTRQPLDFETTGKPEAGDVAAESNQDSRPETFGDKRRREHEEYKKKRDADPAFIPNRGAFFMHDQRHAGAGQVGMRPLGRGRGRGKPVGGPFSPANLMAQAAEPVGNPWKHDLHESVNDSVNRLEAEPLQPVAARTSPPSSTVLNSTRNKTSSPNRYFSNAKQIGRVQIRVAIWPDKDAITFSEVPVKQYTKLPNHRPPLRRDKPVRVSLPDTPVRYIFPSTERSFIFIPRAQRPNQQFLRGRGRPFGSIGGFSSRRTSAYGGSMYSPSVGMSRRSSFVGQFGKDGLITPTEALARAHGVYDQGRPVVRLPPGSQQHTAHGTPIHSATMSGAGTPVVSMPPPQNYALPQIPAFRENWSGPIPMHQPRPQKNVSVSGIESPESLAVHAPQQQEQQPFHQQVPAHMHHGSTEERSEHSRQASFTGQASSGTPLSNIPETAIHAQPFQPFQPAGFPPQQYVPQPAYFYPAGGQAQYGNAVMAPVLVSSQPGAFMYPTLAPTAPAMPAPPVPGTLDQAGTVPYEMNGMVYYYDQSQQPPQQAVEGYSAHTGYSIPGIGGMMTPTPDGAYYYPQVPQGTVYYAPQ